MTTQDFDFANHAAGFDAHISASIPGHDRLRWWTTQLSRRFVREGTRVIDVGCSTGSTLKQIHDLNRASRPAVGYVGIDICDAFCSQWKRLECDTLQFQVRDATQFAGFNNISLVITSFTLQFIAEHKRLALLKLIHDGLVDGGALLLAEKTLAASSALQDMIAFAYYDHKRLFFSADDILDKERCLRGVMTPWTRVRLLQALRAAGFEPYDIEAFWQDGPFVGLIAMKGPPVFRARIRTHD